MDLLTNFQRSTETSWCLARTEDVKNETGILGTDQNLMLKIKMYDDFEGFPLIIMHFCWVDIMSWALMHRLQTVKSVN